MKPITPADPHMLAGRWNRREVLKRAFALGLSASAVAQLLAACGGTGAPATPSGPSATTAAAGTSSGNATVATKPATGAPKRGGTLTIALGTDVATFDSMRLSGLPSFGIVNQVTEQLVRISGDGKLRARLAESWKQSQDGATWTLMLRRNLKFHDGTPFDASAVKNQLERFLAVSPGKAALAAIDRVEVVDQHSVNIITKGPYSPLMNALSYAPVVISSPAAIEKAGEGYGSPATGAVGAGPFKFVAHRRGEEVRLEANKEYWNGAPYLDAVVMKPIPETGSRVIALEAGQADLIFQVPPRDAQRLEQDGRFQIIRAPSERIPYLTMNNAWGVFRDKRVRQAVFYAIDRQAIVDRILLGNAQVAKSPVPSTALGFAPVLKYTYDPAKARQLLAEANYPNGFDVTLAFPPGRFLSDTEVVEAIQQFLSTVGIRVDIVKMEFAAWQAASRKPVGENQLQLTLVSRGAATLDADKALSDFTSGAWSPNGLNLAFYKNDEVDRLVEQQRTMTDQNARLDILRKIQELIADDVPDIYLYEEVQILGAKASLKGVEVDPTQVLLPLDKAWLESR